MLAFKPYNALSWISCVLLLVILLLLGSFTGRPAVIIGCTTIGTNDLPRALNCYDALMEQLGATRIFNIPRGVTYGDGKGPMLGALTPLNQQPATPGNGSMIAFGVDAPEEVQRLYDFALSYGATDEGAPGPKGDGKFYYGYFRDLDKNKCKIFCYLSTPA